MTDETRGAGETAEGSPEQRLAELGLAEGMTVAAGFKASAPHLMPPGAVLDTPTAAGL